MLKHGCEDDAVAALRNAAATGDELCSRVDAASELYVARRTEENRALVVALLAVKTEDPSETVFSSTLSLLLGAGEMDLVLPHLTAMLDVSDEGGGFSAVHDAVEAATAIARYYTPEVARSALEKLLSSPVSSSDQARVIAALADAGFEAEAREHLLKGIAGRSIQVDWFTIDLLIKLGLENEARRLGQAAIEQLLEQTRPGHDVVAIVDHLRPLDGLDTIATCIRTHLMEKPDADLAVCLARLGHGAEAMELLLKYLQRSDRNLNIRAAAALCKVGGDKVGLLCLRAIARDSAQRPRDRLAAADELRWVGALRRAAVAFARIARDPSVPTADRCRAASAFDELQHARNDVVWHALMEVVDTTDRPVLERVEAAKTLISIDGDDGYYDVVWDRLLCMLGERGLSDRDVLRIGMALGECGWSLSELPRVREAIQGERVGVSEKIDALRTFRRCECDDVVPQLLVLAGDPLLPIDRRLQALEALGTADETASVLLIEFVRNASLPPDWRLRAAKELPLDQRTALLQELAGDASIAVQTRIEAVEALPKSMKQERRTALACIAEASDLTVWEHIGLAEAAHRAGALELVRTSLKLAGEDQPLSISELVALTRAHRVVGDGAEASRLMDELIRIPLVVFEHCEDLTSVLEGLTLAAAEHRTEVVDILRGLLASDSRSWWTVTDVIGALEDIDGRASAVHEATPVIAELSNVLRDPGGEEDAVSWPYICQKFRARGWWRDFSALLCFAKNETVATSARADACVLLTRHTPSHSADRAAAGDMLAKMLSSTDLDPSDRIRVAAKLHHECCEHEAAAWLDSCLKCRPLQPEDRRALARLLVRADREQQALELLGENDPELATAGFHLPGDGELLERAFGEDEVRAAKIKRVLGTAEPLYDRLYEARELVENCGDPRALKLLSEAAASKSAMGEEQLEAIDCLEQLGFRSLSRHLLKRMNKKGIEPYWLAGQLMPFGQKSEAATLFVAAARSPLEYNESLVLGGLADLGRSEEIVRFVAQRGDA